VIELKLHPLAEAELEAAARFYEARVRGLGNDFLNEVRCTFSFIQQWPESGVPHFRRYRRSLVHRFPYSVIYELLPSGGHVLAVAHQRQRPGYWRQRR
jgi:plasmid stabilization system protein ParE